MNNKKIILFSFAVISTPSLPAVAVETDRQQALSSDAYVFDPALFRGGRFSQATLSRLAQADAIAPGKYKVDIYINGKFVTSDYVDFVTSAENSVQPCLTPELLNKSGISTSKSEQAANCTLLSQSLKGASSHFDMSQLRLNISVPQNLMQNLPRGYVPIDALDVGDSLGFINYISNIYHVSYSGNNNNQDSAWLSLNGGINFGAWQYRELSTLNWSHDTGSHWNNIRSYLQRPLPSIQSQMAMGQLITTGRFFSGLNYNGIALSTDDRMLPDSMRGYAPIIRGLATSNSIVSISQNGNEIYQTTVAPGSFEIKDLYPTSYSGDLQVKVTGADGTVTTFSVPFSAVPDSIRPGLSRYQIAIGRTRDSGDNSLFGDMTFQRGLTNSITANSGARMADGYQALMFGGVFGSYFGALGLDLTWSHAKMPEGQDTSGWMAHVSYSKTFQPTNTTVSLANYRYSASGYRDLSDVLGVRKAAHSGERWQSSTWQQRSRFDLSLNQSMQALGNLFITGSLQSYRNNRGNDTQLQFGYSNSFRSGISFNLTVARQRTAGEYGSEGAKETVTSASISIPLGSGTNHAATLSNSWTHTSSGDQYQATASGVADEAQTLSYNLSALRDQSFQQNIFSAGVQKRLPDVNLGFNASSGNGYWQASGNAQGALALHSGGVTFGPYLGETFALVEAKGAEGAKVYNSQQTSIDSRGFALIPAITPYRFNRIILDPQGMDEGTELINSEKEIAPIAGAGVKVVFTTRSGVPLLITARLSDHSEIPLGAEVLDENGAVIGMAGQGGQIYVRAEKEKGILTVRWGDGADEHCGIHYNVGNKDKNQPLIRLVSECR
ncbi:fimbrial biogenesis outer membrane usher protein [Klebsiella aerogenes]|nr:fimbrial biogenesis outer membrane usher protein [Klebsiella aerogenes]